jgi:hypothetical protein
VQKVRIGALGMLVAVSLAVTGSGGAGAASASPSAAAAAKPAAAVAPEAPAAAGSAPADAAQTRLAAQQRQQEEAELTGDIDFSVPSGTFQGEVSVGLSTSIANAQIRYTTDGSLPTAASPLYGSPVVLDASTQLRAQAFVGGAASGAPGTQVYVARAVTSTHDLPLLVLDAYGAGKPNRTDYIDVATMLMEPQGGTASLTQTPTVATRAGFHLRGQSSSSFEKAPYRLELWNNEDDDADYPMAGMPADSDWVLKGPFPDKTLIRDAFAYTLAQDMGLKAPRFKFVELYLNLDSAPMATNDYQGVYLLVETIKINKDRLNLQKLKATDLTEPAISGGYLLQFNAAAAEEPILQCTPPAGVTGYQCWRDLELVDPKDVQPQQEAWITDYIQRFHDSLRSANPSDPQTGYPAYIDVDSFVNRIIHNELAREGDSYIRSTHFYKDRGGKLTAGPVWDNDLSYGAYDGLRGVQGFQFSVNFAGFSTSDWFVRLMQDPAFREKVQARWQQLRSGIMSDAQLQARITALTTPLTNAAARNFQRWPILSSRQVGPFPTQVTQTWPEQLDLLSQFMTQRAAWLDGSGWTPTTTTPPGGGPVPPAKADETLSEWPFLGR